MSKIKSKTGSRELTLSTFKIGAGRFGINILNIQEINKDFNITKVPGALDYIEGILNLRGQIVTTIDLGKKLGISQVRKDSGNRNIILRSQGEYIGLLVDEITEVTTAAPEDVQPPPSNINGVRGKYLAGVLKTSRALFGILNIDEVLKA